MTNLVTPTEVIDATGLSVDAAAIATAQAVLVTVGNVDLTPATVLLYTVADLDILKAALFWQIRYLDANPDALNRAGDLASASANGSSVTFREGGDGALAPLAARELGRLSWRAAAKPVTVSVLRARPQFAAVRRQPDPWGDKF